MRWAAGTGSEFEMTVRKVELTPLWAVELAVTEATASRTRQLVLRGDPEMLSVVLSSSGGFVLDQAGRQTAVGPDRIAMYDSSRPLEMRFAPAGGLATVVCVHAPRALLELPLGGLDRILARPLPTGPGSGFGGLLTHLVNDVIAHAKSYGPADRSRLGNIARDLLTAMLVHHLEAEGPVEDGTHQTTLLLRVEAFIQQHLHSPSLTPAQIAAAHHISLSHLHRLFASRGTTTVAAWIRRKRLERARRDLADPALRPVPVHRIATRWGFTSHSSFTRAFHAAYGTSPRDYRHYAAVAAGIT